MPKKPIRKPDERWTFAQQAYRDGDSVETIAARLAVSRETVLLHRSRENWERAGAAAARVVARLAKRFDPQMQAAEAALAEGDTAGAERRAKALAALARAASALAAIDRAPDAAAERRPEAPEDPYDDDRAYVVDHAQRLLRQRLAREHAEGRDA
jgi:hypothetical protein